MHKNQDGFSPIVIVVIALVVAVVGFVGMAVLRSDKNEGAPVQKATSSKSDEEPEGTTDNSATKYLTIKEWGVKFALTSDTYDAYYDDNTSSSFDSFSLRSRSLDSEPDCSSGSQSVASIFRVRKDAGDEMLPGKMIRETREGQVIGDYFYFIESSQYSCTQDEELQVKLQGVRNGFNTASITIQKS